jgi:glyoxylase-like metal-dependent hydrolase (beta-lactamase superfamily II)
MTEILPGVHLIDGSDKLGAARFGPTNVCLLVDHGAVTMVDAGMPGVIGDRLLACLDGLGLEPQAVRRLIITHHHLDHVGGAPEVVALTGAEVWAHRDDAGVIDGSVPREPLSPERREKALAMMPAELREAAARSFDQMLDTPTLPVDVRLVGGEELSVLGGCRILHTPGHTAGHLSLHLPALSLLIAGDLLGYGGGVIKEAPPFATADAAVLRASAREMTALPVDRFIGYHGGYLTEGAGALLRELGERLA